MIDNKIIRLGTKHYVIDNIISVGLCLKGIEIIFVDKSKMIIQYDNDQDKYDDLTKILNIISNSVDAHDSSWTGEFKGSIIKQFN